MANTGLTGPFMLTDAGINQAVVLSSPGVYVLGTSKDGTFYIDYVGRSDSDLNSRLKNWVGQYLQFKYGYFDSPLAAFEKECAIFHDFGGSGMLDNENHPQRPVNSHWQCPRCNLFI